MGRGGGQVFSISAFYSDDTSLNIAKVYNFSVKVVTEKIENKQKGRDLPILKLYNDQSLRQPEQNQVTCSDDNCASGRSVINVLSTFCRRLNSSFDVRFLRRRHSRR